MTVFTMFFIELMASRFDVFGEQHASDLEKSDPAKDLMRGSEKYGDTDSTLQKGKHYPLFVTGSIPLCRVFPLVLPSILNHRLHS
jgi:hypothetical protein